MGSATRPALLDPTVRHFLPGVEGLRAVAVMLVLLYHLSIPGLEIGWMGVNLFFVISGYLITGILLRTRGRSGYLRCFYARRVLRIWPIYYLALVAMIAYAIVATRPWSAAPWYAVFLQNYLLGWNNWGVGFPVMFVHTWSLAVEEQFYLLWPFLVLVLSCRRLWVLLAVMFVVAPLSRYAFVHIDKPFLAFASLPADVDSLAAGAALALLASRRSLRERLTAGRAYGILGVAAAITAALVAVIGWDVIARPQVFLTHPGAWLLFTPLALACAALVALAAGEATVVTRVLSLWPLRAVGRISYGVYLYHLPVRFFVGWILGRWVYEAHGQSWGGRPLVIILNLGLTLGLAAMSWRFIERPILGLKRRYVVGGPTGAAEADAGLPGSRRDGADPVSRVS